jgi:hypothetical protein
MAYRIGDDAQAQDFINAREKCRNVEALLEQAEKLINEIEAATTHKTDDGKGQDYDLPDLQEAQELIVFVTDDITTSLDEWQYHTDVAA